MKALIEIEITGDFTENLTDAEIDALLDAVIGDGADACCLTGTFDIKEIIER